MRKKTERLHLRFTKEEKDFIVNKAKEEGFATIQAFIYACTRKSVSLNIDTSDYRELVSETRTIGRNINSLIRDIRFSEYFKEQDIRVLESSIKNIEDMLEDDRKSFSNLENDFERLSAKRLKRIISNSDIKVPDEFIYDNIIEMIKDNLFYITEQMKKDKWKDHTIEPIYRFIYGLIPEQYDIESITVINDKIYNFVRAMKNKQILKSYYFTGNEYNELMDLIYSF